MAKKQNLTQIYHRVNPKDFDITPQVIALGNGYPGVPDSANRKEKVCDSGAPVAHAVGVCQLSQGGRVAFEGGVADSPVCHP